MSVCVCVGVCVYVSFIDDEDIQVVDDDSGDGAADVEVVRNERSPIVANSRLRNAHKRAINDPLGGDTDTSHRNILV